MRFYKDCKKIREFKEMNMEKFRKCRILSVVLTVMVVGSGFASSLPGYMDAYYHGTSYFSDGGGGAIGRVDFAVYDTDTDGDPFLALGDTLEGSGRYIYAYQITRSAGALGALDFFGITGMGADAIDLVSNSTSDIIGSVSDDPAEPTEAIAATDAYFSSDLTTGIWEFDYDDEHLGVDDYSYFLLLKSDSLPTFGDYTFTPPVDDGIIVPGDAPPEGAPALAPMVVPEPFTIVLLGLGSVGVFSRQRKKKLKV